MGLVSLTLHLLINYIQQVFSVTLEVQSLNALIMLTSIHYRAFATKLKAGATKKTKDSIGRRLGVKKFGGEEVFPGDILIR